MDLPKQLGDLECSMFEPPAKRSRPSPFRLSQAVPKRFLKGYIHTPEEKMGTVSFFARIFPALLALLTGELCFRQYKATLVIQVAMSKSTPDGKRKVAYPFLASRPFVVLIPEDIHEGLAKAESAIEANIDEWTREGFDWVVDCVETMYVNIAKYQPLKGSSYIQVPDHLKGKQAIINVKNQDDECLKWALLSAIHPIGSNPH